MSRVADNINVVTEGGAPVSNGEENLPFLARVINHVLTPGSSLSPIVWISFNIVMLGLFGVWLMFVVAMPKNIHVWAFGFLGVGLTASTNWLMKIIFSSGLDFASQQQREAVVKESKDRKND
ncbi:putative ER protein Pkr1 [Leishmania naiffi]|uniref:ER protein Pkr1 n=2 Tax=Viannia TaxID=37616 RepID=A0AAW3AI50_9TRYP